MATAAESAANEATDAPATNAARRPTRADRYAVGTVATDKPTSSSATGSVARLGLGASRVPTRPPASVLSGAALAHRAWAATSNQMFRGSFMSQAIGAGTPKAMSGFTTSDRI